MTALGDARFVLALLLYHYVKNTLLDVCKLGRLRKLRINLRISGSFPHQP